MNIEQERANFEAWYMREFEVYPRRNESGGFKSQYVNAMFKSWKAGRAALQSQDREDTDRLDWLDKVAHCADWVEGEPTKRVIRAHDGAEFTGDTWREAIDHARRIEGEAMKEILHSE